MVYVKGHEHHQRDRLSLCVFVQTYSIDLQQHMWVFCIYCLVSGTLIFTCKRWVCILSKYQKHTHTSWGPGLSAKRGKTAKKHNKYSSYFMPPPTLPLLN